MQIELIGALDYEKVKRILKAKGIDDENAIDEIAEEIKKVEKARHAEKVASAGFLSRTTGNAFTVIGDREAKDIEKNTKFANIVMGMGHTSIGDHDYLLFALKDVSVVVEQILIEERFSSFTVKSRREADFSKEGFYTPDFHNKRGLIHEYNEDLKKEYNDYMKTLFEKYTEFKENGIISEDARFILPYCFHSTFYMGMDASTLMRTIIKLTKTKYAKNAELKAVGDRLYDIAKENTPYLIPIIDGVEVNLEDEVQDYLDKYVDKKEYKVIDKVKLINSSNNIDEQIIISAIMRRYQYNYAKSKALYDRLMQSDPKFIQELMRKIAFTGDKAEFSQVNFEFQVPVSNAIKTHLLRHRTHRFVNPDFDVIDLKQYKTPPMIQKNNLKNEYDFIFEHNNDMYEYFKSYGIPKEDLIYFNLSGNTSNFVTNMDGLTLSHILALRECNKAQWETRIIAHEMHKEIRNLEGASEFSKVIGPTCETQLVCHEGKECCGKIHQLLKTKDNN